jgi:hypothetical protein
MARSTLPQSIVIAVEVTLMAAVIIVVTAIAAHAAVHPASRRDGRSLHRLRWAWPLRYRGPIMMNPPDTRQILAAATASLRDVHSIRDYTIAVEVGSKVAISMLDDIEKALVKILRTVNADAEP